MTHPIEDPEDAYLRKEEGRELRALRMRAGLTQKELAVAVRIHPSSIAEAEQGLKALNDATRVKVMAHLAIIAGRAASRWPIPPLGGRGGGEP